MGLKLAGLLHKKQITFEELRNKKIAIDASNSLYQFLSSIRQPDGTPLMDSKGNITSHLQGLFSRTLNLMNKGLKICYVFDGKPPSLKQYEKEEREHRKRLAEEKLKRAMEEEDTELMSRYAKQTARLTKDMVKESKELVKAMGLPVIQAPSEAEAQAAFMTEKKDVYAVGSSDHDSLLFGAPRLIQNLTLAQRKKLPSGMYIKIQPEIIILKEILKDLKLNQDQLIVLGILMGTDYNKKGIPGIGPKKALLLVQQNKNFDKLFSQLNPDFNWKKIFAIFKSMPIMKNYQLKWQELSEKKVLKILVDKHEFNEERIQKLLDKSKQEQDKKKQKSLGDF